MMVWFTYAGDRLDYKVSGWESDDCTATKFTPSYMTSVDVQVWDQGGLWQTLRRYELGTGYSAGVSNDSANCKNSNNYCVRLLLNELQVKGKHGGLLQRYVTPPVKGLLSKVERALSICWSGYPVGKYDPA